MTLRTAMFLFLVACAQVPAQDRVEDVLADYQAFKPAPLQRRLEVGRGVDWAEASTASFWAPWAEGKSAARATGEHPFLELEWADSYVKAQERAKREGKPIMAHFTRATITKPPC